MRNVGLCGALRLYWPRYWQNFVITRNWMSYRPSLTKWPLWKNADTRSLLVSERPDLIGNPYIGSCPNGDKVRTPTCWFNPNAFAVPPRNQFGNAGRNMLRGPAFEQLDLVLRKSFRLGEGKKVTFGAEAFNLLNHPNFAVPSNTQSPLTQGGNGDAVFKDSAGDSADNVGRIFSTVGSSRQIQLAARLVF